VREASLDTRLKELLVEVQRGCRPTD